MSMLKLNIFSKQEYPFFLCTLGEKDSELSDSDCAYINSHLVAVHFNPGFITYLGNFNLHNRNYLFEKYEYMYVKI